MTIHNKIQIHYKEQKYAHLIREKEENHPLSSRGYVVAYSDSFIILHEVIDFRLSGLNILPIPQIKKIRHNKYDLYYDYIMASEGLKENIGKQATLDLTSWSTILRELIVRDKAIIIECEGQNKNSFTIGKITKVSQKKVHIHNFNAIGYLDKKPTTIKIKHITRVIFDDHYIDTFSRYSRQKAPKVQEHKSDH